jgi:prevent-host-death family protein
MFYTCGMADPNRIPVRDLRNHVSDVLRRVEAGETLEVTVNNRPVALLVPKRSRPRTVSTQQFLSRLRQADPALSGDLASELTETTDDLGDPWPV